MRYNEANVQDPQMETDENISKITCEIISHTGCRDQLSSSPKGKITVKNLPKVKRLAEKFSVAPKFQIRDGGKPLYKSKKCCGYPLCASTYRQRDPDWYRSFKPIVTFTHDCLPSCSTGLDSIECPGSSTTAIARRTHSSLSSGNHFIPQETSNNVHKSNTFSKITFMKTHPVIRLKSSARESVTLDVQNCIPSKHLSFPGENIPIDRSEPIDETCSSYDGFNLLSTAQQS